ncbi:MAG: aspartate carbamoyltransferase regulatory subunit, partial [Prevotellaceae bacterium]|nr:aspartate carbamoyltransferase regulatory subunit [Prevotellaceae bacterium]
MKKDETHLVVSAIKDGTVIDHIPSSNLFKVVEILALNGCQNQLTIGSNLESKLLGTKSIIKISDRFFEDEEINRIALVAPKAKFNIIRNYEVVEKRMVEIPDQITGIAKCMNPKCVTNHEPVATKFSVVSKKDVLLKCAYCDKLTD